MGKQAITTTAIDLFHRLGPWHDRRVYQQAIKNGLTRQNQRVMAAPKVPLKDEWGEVLAVYRPHLTVRDGEQTWLVHIALPSDDLLAAEREVKAWLSAWQGQAVGMLLHFGERRMTWKIIPRGYGNRNRKGGTYDNPRF